MRGAWIAPRETPSGIAAGLVLVFVCLICAFAPAAAAAPPANITIDFSQHGEGPFDQSYFNEVEFTEGSWVGYIQGDQALVGPASGKANWKFTSISARVAPTTQGTATYTLTAYNGNGHKIADSSVTVTQDTGDPQTGPWGYATIELGPLPKKAQSFRLTNAFVRSSYSHITQIEFGISSITVSREAHS
jgi:hypothetical protein